MDPRKMDRLVSIKTKSVTQNDTGEEVITWDLVETVWAQVVPLRALERWSSQQVKASIDHKFLIRYRDDITPVDIIEFEGKEYDIYSINEVGRRQALEIMATTRAE